MSGIIKANEDFDVALSSRASEATLLAQNDWSTTQATTTVAASATSVLLIAASATRRQVTIRNTANKTLYLCMFTPATVATPFILAKDEVWVFPKWRGLIYGIWDTGATGNAYITQESE